MKKEEKIEGETHTKEVEQEDTTIIEVEEDHRTEGQVVVVTGEADLNDGTVLGPHPVSGVWMGGGVERQK